MFLVALVQNKNKLWDIRNLNIYFEMQAMQAMQAIPFEKIATNVASGQEEVSSNLFLFNVCLPALIEQ